MNLEGRIDITLRYHPEVPVAVHIESTRPHVAQKLLAGRSPAEAANLVGLVFSLCGNAQRIAAEAACEAALGMQPDLTTRVARDQAVLRELAREHAWRLLLDWPQQAGKSLGIAADMASLLCLRQADGDSTQYAQTLDDLLRTTLLSEPADEWLTRDLAAFDAWQEAGETSVARLFNALGHGPDRGVSQVTLLPPLQGLTTQAARSLAAGALTDVAFCAQPLWQGAPAETGAVGRLCGNALLAGWIEQRGRGVGARMLARLLELAVLPGLLQAPTGDMVRAWSLDENVGAAGVETSRGLLLHAVRLHAGKIVEYRIVAPTEWNFHPTGALAQALSSLSAPPAMLAVHAGLIVQSLDPCVAFDINLIETR